MKMLTTRNLRLAAATAAWTIVALAPALATAQQQPNGYPVTNVNLRAGPGTDYPVIVTVPARSPIAILGCLPDYGWCDSIFQGNRGWMRSIYLSGWYQGNYYALRDYAPRLGYRTVTFDIEGYWGKNYRNRPFYGERTRWTRPREEGYVNTGAFYKRLSPHGNWTWIQGQYVWVPARVDRSWRPYTQGRWVYTNRGWTWVSNEPFGWATYHYGRWGFSNRVGWFWVPGNRWAPAWVSWRQGGDHLAWAPLPPSYDEGVNINISIGNAVPDYYWQVVPSRAFLSNDLNRQIVRDRNRYGPLLERTRPIGNTTITNNNVVVNNVVNVTYVEQQTQERVVEKKIAVTDNAKAAGKVEGDAVEVYQPSVAEVSDPKELAPPEPKKIEEVAKESQTKEQGEGQAATDEMLVPPEIKKAEETTPKAGEGAAPAGLPQPLPEGDKAAAPPPDAPPPPSAPVAAEDLTPAGADADSSAPAQVEKAPTAPPPVEGAPPPPAINGDMPPPPPPADTGPVAPGLAPDAATPPPPPVEDMSPGAPPKAATPKNGKAREPGPDGLPPMVPMEDAPPPPPGEDAAPPPPPPPAKDDAPPPPPPPVQEESAPPPPPPPVQEESAPPRALKEMAPPPPPPVQEESAPPPPPPPVEEPKRKKDGNGQKQKSNDAPPPVMEDAAPPPPPPPMDEPAPKPKKERKGQGNKNQGNEDNRDAPPPPPAMEEFAPPPPSAEESEPKPKREGKGRRDNDGTPPSDDGNGGGGGDNGDRPKKGKKDGGPPPCPEGTVPVEGGCAPIQ